MSVRYERKDHTIVTFTKDEEGKTTKNSKTYLGGRDGKTPSINAAKKASFKLQKAKGGLGCGILRLV